MEEKVENKKHSAMIIRDTIILIVIAAFIVFAGLYGICTKAGVETYICKYCGTEMQSYWSYHDGYICYDCDKKYFKNDSNKNKDKDGNVYNYNYYE